MLDESRPPDAICDGGDLDCGSGLLLIIREAMAPLPAGGVLEVRSREISVKEDLPAWCRLVGHTLLSVAPAAGNYLHFRIAKKSEAAPSASGPAGGAEASLADDLANARAFTWSARVRWTSGMQAKAFVRNHSFVVGQPASFDTSDVAPSAVEFLLAALGGCLAVGMQWRASRRGIEVRNLEVSLKAGADDILVFLGVDEPAKKSSSSGAEPLATDSVGHPGLRSIEGTLFVDADADDATLESLFEETVVRSPVAQTLLRQVPVKVQLRRA
jgi:uncharacterized OsmC-like protein/TusA-related sulfurtransferase